MVKDFELRLLPEQAFDESALRGFLVKENGWNAGRLKGVRMLRRSIDARQRQVVVNVKVRAYVDEMPAEPLFERIDYKVVDGEREAIVVGAGPGGLFAALRLIELGVRPIVLERGKDVRARRKDVAAIKERQRVDPESNYSFGEGGAGAFSDGKLYTRSKKRGNVDKVLRVFCQHGASQSILVDVHPHLGTDKLPGIIENMRNTILDCGGEVHFQTKVTRLTIEGETCVGVEAVTASGETKAFRGPVILATGHSARDVYAWLYNNNVEIEAKDLAMGVRLEHPAELIDRIQYHSKDGKGKYLPTAEYSFVCQMDGRGVYSFCMCPGGTVVPAASGDEQVVVNGMSASLRNSPWSNSGMVVEVRREDLAGMTKSMGRALDVDNPLCMMHFQEWMERNAWLQTRSQVAPAQRMVDFVQGKISGTLPRSSYTPGLLSAPLHFLLPKPISGRLAKGFQRFGQMSRGFLTNEALMIGVETRTSSPVRIVRDGQTLQHVRIKGLYPCGEGAGYAGGIVSAAIDGERCAEMLSASLQ